MKLLIPLALSLVVTAASAQQRFSTANEFTFSLSHAHLGSGVEGGDKKWLILPSFGFDYTYRFAEHWYTGIHSDIIIRHFNVEANLDGSDVVLGRSTPVASALVIGYQIDDHLSFQLGAGAEFAREGTYALARAGADYKWKVSDRWNVGLSLQYDAKIEHYDTWIFGATATRVFRN